MDIPFYEECSFGYYEWYAKKDIYKMRIYRQPVLASFKRIRSDREYELNIKYDMKNSESDKFSGRNEAYEVVRKHWKNNNLNKYLGYMDVELKGQIAMW